jgi:membrane protease YdiL (CAAX protease family)
MYKPWLFEGAFDRPLWLNTILFEIVYISDFFMVELVFRGVLVIGMQSLMGRSAVLPMIAAYEALHFGKPMLETISSVFGGYFLGALAFRTGHIWGGIIIHMGIALIIELLRFFQYYLLMV